MRNRLRSALAVCLLVSALGATRATADFPENEVWLGAGGATAFEKNIFNVPDDIESVPEAAFSLGFMKNLDARRGVGVHVYGASETTPPVFLVGPGGIQQAPFDLNSLNFGVRYRYTFSSGALKPYVFAGASWALGTIESTPTGELKYGGISACVGPGVRVGLGHRFMLSAEGIGSLGVARWEDKPFVNSSGKEFNPSIAGGTINLSFVWGWKS